MESLSSFQPAKILRTSEDYQQDVKDMAKLHAVFNTYNLLYLRYFGIPDFDMFMTVDDNATFQAILRALSGGIVYITDIPGMEKEEIIKRIALSDSTVPIPMKF
ncbi:hypothetical protein HS7_12010 [Sulfolobales archaeon HS-7]|nr:hypothetical protein HS7_12010 [Sulfolobales archaeon HS-7]